MSEEEIIKNIKEQIQWSDHTKERMALQGLLDLYNKEKENNKLLIEGKFREVADKNSYIKDNYISKDKIKEKIEEIINNSSRFNCISPLNWNEEYYKTRFAVDNLQELLKEGEVNE